MPCSFPSHFFHAVAHRSAGRGTSNSRRCTLHCFVLPGVACFALLCKALLGLVCFASLSVALPCSLFAYTALPCFALLCVALFCCAFSAARLGNRNCRLSYTLATLQPSFMVETLIRVDARLNDSFKHVHFESTYGGCMKD